MIKVTLVRENGTTDEYVDRRMKYTSYEELEENAKYNDEQGLEAREKIMDFVYRVCSKLRIQTPEYNEAIDDWEFDDYHWNGKEELAPRSLIFESETQ